MIKAAYLWIALLTFFGDCSAREKCSNASEYRPVLCQVSLPRIVAIEITENGARAFANAEPQLDCRKFALTIPQVRRYFSKAKQIQDPLQAHNTLDWLPCYASGKISFAGGQTATWVIEQSQTARLLRTNLPELLLYCPACKFTPFMW